MPNKKEEKIIVKDGVIYDFDDESVFEPIQSFGYKNFESDRYDKPGEELYRRKDNDTFYHFFYRGPTFFIISKKELIKILEKYKCSPETYKKAGIPLKKVGDSKTEDETIVYDDRSPLGRFWDWMMD